MVLSGYVLNNVSACHKLPWFTMHHASGQAWHLNIQSLRIREWDHNCFVTLTERTGNVNLCHFNLSRSQRNRCIPVGKLGQLTICYKSEGLVKH